MNYSTAKLATIADCDLVLNRCKLEKATLEHRLGGIVLENDRSDGTLAAAQASLLSANAQITGFTAAFDSLPLGPEKTEMGNKLRKLNDQKENLEERLGKSGTTGLLLSEMHRGRMEAELAELVIFVAAIEARKAAL